MDETSLPEVDNSVVIESEPVSTSQNETTPVKKQPIVEEVEEPEEKVEKPEDEPKEAEDSKEKQDGDDEKTEAPTEKPKPTIDMDLLKELNEASKYQPKDTNFDILDEYGALDPTKFQAFMAENNQNVFNQATNSVLSKLQAEKLENDMWEDVNTKYPELKENENLKSALKGARIQDLISGGKGDLNELAKGIVGTIRDNKVKAIESVNKTITKQESLSSFKPSVAQTEKVPTSLMTQLKQAMSNGDAETANRIRHEIRKERIFGKQDE